MQDLFQPEEQPDGSFDHEDDDSADIATKVRAPPKRASIKPIHLRLTVTSSGVVSAHFSRNWCIICRRLTVAALGQKFKCCCVNTGSAACRSHAVLRLLEQLQTELMEQQQRQQQEEDEQEEQQEEGTMHTSKFFQDLVAQLQRRGVPISLHDLPIVPHEEANPYRIDSALVRHLSCHSAGLEQATNAAFQAASMSILAIGAHTPPFCIRSEIVGAAIIAAHTAHADYLKSPEGLAHLQRLESKRAAATALYEHLMSKAPDGDKDSNLDDGASDDGLSVSSGDGGNSKTVYYCSLCLTYNPHKQHLPMSRRCRLQIQKRVNAAGGDTTSVAEGWLRLQEWREKNGKPQTSNGSSQQPENKSLQKRVARAGPDIKCPLCLRRVGVKSKTKCGKTGSIRCMQAARPGLASLDPENPTTPPPSHASVRAAADLLSTDQLLKPLGLHEDDGAPSNKRPILIFGGPGTGKSFTLIRFVEVLRILLDDAAVPLLAAFGVVAQNVCGATIHSWAGIGPTKSAEICASDLLQVLDSRAVRRWKDARVLAIDDASILSRELFDVLEELARLVRGNGCFFGGLLLILQFDLEQLPPVTTTDAPRHPLYPIHARQAGSKHWNHLMQHSLCIHLKQQHRFQSDPLLVNLQEALRCNLQTKKSNITDSLCRHISAFPSPVPSAPSDIWDLPEGSTWLCPRRQQVCAAVPKPNMLLVMLMRHAHIASIFTTVMRVPHASPCPYPHACARHPQRAHSTHLPQLSTRFL